MPGQLRIAGVGCGYFSQFHYDAWRRLEVELVAVCDNDAELAGETAATYSVARNYTDIATMLTAEKPDLLDIITPPQSHLPLIRQAAALGIDVICQKPFTLDFAQAEEAVNVAAQAGIRLIVHENFRFQPWYRVIAGLLADGELGELYNVCFRLRPGDGQGEDAYLQRQPGFQQMRRFLVNETAVHFVDVFRFLFGEITNVYASLRRLNPAIAGEDAGQVLIGFANGVDAILDANRLADHAAQNRRLTMGELRIDGSAGELGLDGDGGLKIRRHGENKWRPVDYEWHDHGFGGDCVYLLQKHVIDHLLHGAPLENSAADYLANLRAVEAIYESAADGRRHQL